MKSTLAPLEGNKIKLSVEVEEAEFDRDIDAAFRKIAQEVRLPGFRPGKAPRRVLEARMGIAPAREQALRDAIPQYLAKAVREHDVDIIDTPQVDITGGTDDGPVQFDATIDVRPKVTVPSYGGLRVEVPSPIVSDEEVQAPIDNELRRNGDLVDVDRPAVRGDYVTLDLAAFRDGDAVPGLNTEDWLYEIGRGWVAESFDDELVGATADDVVTFSAPPSGTDEAADFTVNVKKVQELQLPELTDEWVSENLGEFDTVEAWRESIRNRLQATRAGQLRQAVVERTSQALAELVDDEPPQVLVQAELRGRLENMAMQFQAQGIGFEQYLAVTGQDPETFQSTMTEGATRAVKADLALRAVADAESLEIDDDELEAEYVRIAISVNQKPNQVRKAYEKNDAVADLTAELRKRKAFDWLLERVEIVDPDGKLVERSLVLPEYAGSEDDGDDAATDAAATDTHEEATA